jgi:pimeloyl-ACP methyl ester carboxylesterase
MKSAVILANHAAILAKSTVILAKSAGVLAKSAAVVAKSAAVLAKSAAVLAKSAVILAKSAVILAKRAERLAFGADVGEIYPPVGIGLAFVPNSDLLNSMPPRRFALLFCLVTAPFLAGRAATFTYAGPPGAIAKVYRGQSFQFGYLTVPERHAAPGGKQIQLAVVILRAKQPGGGLPVFFLTGGPGGSATDIAPYFEVFSALQRQHDVVLIDQRGTGYSAPFLGIQGRVTYQGARDGFTNAGIDVTAYNTTEDAADIADLRTALGYSQVVLFANSYGTFLAQEVMRSHPAGIASVVMDGVLPAADTFIPNFNRNALHGLNALFRDVRRTPAANRAFPSFSRTYFKLLQTLRHRPLRMSDGTKVTIDDFQNSIEALLQSPERISLIPLFTTEIAARRGSAFVKRYLSFSDGVRGFAYGMYLSVLGTDWNQPDWLALTRRADAKLRPVIFRQANARSSLAVVFGVEAWQVPYLPQATRTPLQSPIPTLLLAGEMEAQTPFNGASTVAAGLPNSFLLMFPRSGHITGFTKGPALQALLQFVNNPAAKPAYSLASLRRPNFYATTIPPQSKSREAEPPLRFLH